MGHKGFSLPDGDVLIHAGDATSSGVSDEVGRFLEWFASQSHPHKILIAGNHDWLFLRHPDMAEQLLAAYPGITYLQDSGVEIKGIKFWGSPWQPEFCDWAFNLPRKGPGLREVWNRIPIDTEVLITHGPPYGILDQVTGSIDFSGKAEHLGCEELLIRLAAVKPKVHIFGHIHGGYGVAQSKVTTYVNACTCSELYKPSNRPIVVDLTAKRTVVQGIGVNRKKVQLEKIKAMAEAPEPGPVVKVEAWLPEAHLTALTEMASLRGLSVEVLFQNYSMRGLRSDLAQHLKAEGKSSNRPIPFRVLDKDAWPEGYWDSFDAFGNDFKDPDDEP
jgi:predicted phosphodiesterase